MNDYCWQYHAVVIANNAANRFFFSLFSRNFVAITLIRRQHLEITSQHFCLS